MSAVDYGAILRRSKDITLKNKWLWVYGLVLAAFGAGSGFNFSRLFNYSGNSSDTTRQLPREIPPDLPGKAQHVLGAATSAVQDWFFHVPVTTWLALSLGLLFLIGVVLIVSYVVQAWAKSALITGLADAQVDQPVNLISTSSRGLARVNHLLIYGLLATCLAGGFILALIILMVLIFVLLQYAPALRPLVAFFMVLFGIVGVAALVLLTAFTGLYAERLIVLHSFTPWAAWKAGFSLARHHFLPTLIMTVVDRGTSCVVGCLVSFLSLIVMGVPAFILILPSFRNGFHLPSLGVVLVLALLFFIFINLNSLVSAALIVFNYSNWNIFVKQILDEEKKV